MTSTSSSFSLYFRREKSKRADSLDWAGVAEAAFVMSTERQGGTL